MSIVERDMTADEFGRMKAGFIQHAATVFLEQPKFFSSGHPRVGLLKKLP